jgi:hypothetical protein
MIDFDTATQTEQLKFGVVTVAGWLAPLIPYATFYLGVLFGGWAS